MGSGRTIGEEVTTRGRSIQPQNASGRCASKVSVLNWLDSVRLYYEIRMFVK